MKVVFVDSNTLSPAVQMKTLPFTHQWQNYEYTTVEQLVERAANAQVLISNKVPVDEVALRQLPQLKLIAVPATGTNHVDVAACKALGITVCNIPSYAQTTVPEHTLALIFALQRQILSYHRSIAAGRWQESGMFCYFDYPIRDLRGSTLGLVGSGTLGSAVAQLAKCLGMKVLFAGRKGQESAPEGKVPFAQLLAQSDIISLHCPLTAETRHLLGTEEFAQMQRKPLIINTARGELIDAKALAQALEQGQIRGAGLDVCDAEPPAADHPYMQLMQRDDFILTPHVAWASIEAMQHLADQLIDNIAAFVMGEAKNTVSTTPP